MVVQKDGIQLRGSYDKQYNTHAIPWSSFVPPPQQIIRPRTLITLTWFSRRIILYTGGGVGGGSWPGWYLTYHAHKFIKENKSSYACYHVDLLLWSYRQVYWPTWSVWYSTLSIIWLVKYYMVWGFCLTRPFVEAVYVPSTLRNAPTTLTVRHVWRHQELFRVIFTFCDRE